MTFATFCALVGLAWVVGSLLLLVFLSLTAKWLNDMPEQPAPLTYTVNDHGVHGLDGRFAGYAESDADTNIYDGYDGY